MQTWSLHDVQIWMVYQGTHLLCNKLYLSSCAWVSHRVGSYGQLTPVGASQAASWTLQPAERPAAQGTGERAPCAYCSVTADVMPNF